MEPRGGYQLRCWRLPNGFSMVKLSLIGPGINAGWDTARTVPATSSHTSKRQRGDGRCPSGYTSGTPAAAMMIGGTNSTFAAQAA